MSEPSRTHQKADWPVVFASYFLILFGICLLGASGGVRAIINAVKGAI